MSFKISEGTLFVNGQGIDIKNISPLFYVPSETLQEMAAREESIIAFNQQIEATFQVAAEKMKELAEAFELFTMDIVEADKKVKAKKKTWDKKHFYD